MFDSMIRYNVAFVAGWFLLLPFLGCESGRMAETSSVAASQATNEGSLADPGPVSEKPTTKAATTVIDVSETGDWPLFRGNGKSQGVATSKLPEELDVIWQHKVKNGAFEGTPVVVGGESKWAFVGDADGTMFAFDLASGKIRWEFKSEIGYVSAPAFQEGRLYVGDMDGKFYCLDAKSGDKKWEFAADDSIDSSANFHRDLVLFGSRDACLYALNAESGEQKWKLETADQVRCSITVVDGRAFVAGCDGALHIIDLDSGEEVDSVMIESPTGVTPAANGDHIFVGTEQSGFFAINWKTAKTKWTFYGSSGSVSTRCSPAVTDDHVVFGARDRKMYSLNPVSGKENWSTELKANVDSSPVIVGDRLFVGSTDGRFYELELATGKIVWQKQLDGGFVGSPAVGFGRLVIATDRGVVYCLGGN